MRSVLRLGLAAVSLAGSAAVATPASAICAPVSASGGVDVAACTPGCSYVVAGGNGVAVCDNPDPVRLYQSGGDLAVCWEGHGPHQVWVAAPAAGIGAYDQARAAVNAAGLGRRICVAVLQ